MSNQYTSRITLRTPRARSKRLREQGIGGGATYVYSQIAQGYVTTSALQSALANKVDVTFFSRLFGAVGTDGSTVTVNDADTAIASIQAKFGLWTNEFLSAKGQNSNSTGSESSEVVGVTSLAELSDVVLGELSDNQVLAYDAASGMWANKTISVEGGSSGGSSGLDGVHADWVSILQASPEDYVTRWPSIGEVTGKQDLVIRLNGGTTEGTNLFTYNGTEAKTVNITAAAIGALTQSEADGRYAYVGGSNATGTWGISISGNAATATNLGTSTVGGAARPIYLDSGVPTALSSTVGSSTIPVYLNAGTITACGTSLAVSVTGNAATATQLATARTIWGQSFDGTANITGDMTGVGSITMSGSISGATTISASNYIQIGDGRLYWDSTNNALYVEGSDGSAIGFYSNGWISAKGANSSAGSEVVGVTALSELSDVSLGTLTANQVLAWNGTAWVNTTISSGASTWDEITGKPTTLAGYGITDGVNAVTTGGSGNAVTSASISGHTLTLTKGTTFLTSPQAISSGDDLNGYTTPGMYYCQTIVIALSLSNCPTTNAFSLQVERHAGYKQTLTEYQTAGPITYVRNYYNNTWGSWYLVPWSANSAVGSTTQPVYMNSNGRLLACSYALSAAVNSGTSGQLAYYSGANAISSYSSTVGGTARPVYMSSGTITALSSTVGSATRPVYMSSGTITAGTYTFGNDSGNAAINNGTLNTNLNADMLDGLHNGSLTAAYTHAGSISAYRVVTKPDNSGYPVYVLIADCTSTVNASSDGTRYGFSGIIIETRVSGYTITERVTRITARVGYNMSYYSLTTDNSLVQPCILKYGDTYYLAIRLQGSGHVAYFYGFEVNLLSEFTLVNTTDSSGTLPDGYSIAYSYSGINYYGNTISASTLSVSGATTINGGLTLPTGSSAFNDVGIIFSGNVGRIGASSSSGNVGIYTTGTLYLCPGCTTSAASSYGLSIGASSSSLVGALSVSGAITGGSTIYAATGLYSDGYVSALGQNISSDIRLKNIMEVVKLKTSVFAKAPLFRFSWKDREDMVEIGSSAQYFQRYLPDAVKERDGYLEMGYGNIALAGVITIAQSVETLEKRVERLEKENRKIIRRIEA